MSLRTTQADKSARRFTQYGVSSDLSDKAVAANLSVTKVRALSISDLTRSFGLSEEEAKELKKCAVRAPITDDILQILLESSNFTCNVCKGNKGSSFIVHHIVEYEKTQDNSYDNLVVLCPNDHDLAHRGGLSLGISADGLRKVKTRWEKQVEVANAQRAARLIEVSNVGIDYVNVKRIEELCLRLFKKVPGTAFSEALQARGVLDSDRLFDRKYVSEHLSSGTYLFDYFGNLETHHYRDLMVQVAAVTEFADLGEAAEKGTSALQALEGQLAFFIGGVHSKSPDLPITESSPPLVMHYKARSTRIVWDLDPNYLMSMSAIGRMGRTNRYIIYCLVRSVAGDAASAHEVTASPLLIAAPSKFVNKIPPIAYKEKFFVQF